MSRALMQESHAHSGRYIHDVSGSGAELGGAGLMPLQTSAQLHLKFFAPAPLHSHTLVWSEKFPSQPEHT